MTTRVIGGIDPFDLPEWLGEVEVTWTPEDGIHDRYLVPGLLTGGARPVPALRHCWPSTRPTPQPVADDDLRHRAHQAWRHDQVLLVTVDGRLTLAVPGTSFTAELVLETLARLAKAVGARPSSFSVLLRLGG